MAKTPPMPITPDHDRYGICGQRPRPMDNRDYPNRPSAFQAEFGPTPMCFSRSDQTRDRHSDVLDQSVWLVGPILAP